MKIYANRFPFRTPERPHHDKAISQMMKKAMFHKFTNFLQQAVDVVSDSVSLTANLQPQEEFVYHWKSLTSYFVDNKDGNVCIEETALPEHLSSMLRLLQEEDSSLNESGTTGASLEFLLKSRILETLYTLGRTDYPSGMKQIVLSFFTKLLSRISHPLLPHINVHRAVQRMVKTCGETKAGPTEKEEIEFLCTVCAKIKTDPYLVNFFIEGLQQSPPRPEGGHRTANNRKEANHRNRQSFSLVETLIALSHSEDARVSVKACEGLMLCASLPEQSAATALLDHTQFCQAITKRLCQLYDKLPVMVFADDLDKVEAKWGFDNILERNERQAFEGKGHVISFLSWLDYCDQVIAVSNPYVGKALANQIHTELLTGKLLPHLMQLSESGAIVATTYLTRWLRTISSQALLREVCFFLLGEGRYSEAENQNDHALNKRLLERCNHVSEEMCVATLKLFDTLLQKEDEHIFHSLLLKNLLGRSYYTHDDGDGGGCSVGHGTDVAASNTHLSRVEALPDDKGELKCCNNQESGSGGTSRDGMETNQTADERQPRTGGLSTVDSSRREVTWSAESSPLSSHSSSSPSVSSSPPSSASSPGFGGRSEVHKIVNSFLTLLPEEAKSSYDTEDSGYDMYLRDAQRQFSIQETICKDWEWPKRPVQWGEYNRSGRFYEGAFLHMLMDKLIHMLDQSYSVNLLVTAIMSKVALVPHPNIHEFILDPFITVPLGSRTLFSVLQKVSNEIKQHQKTDSSFGDKLVLARKQLMGLVPTIHRFEDQGRMEAIIVLEEFCKELSAITFVKHHAAVTRF